MSSHGRIFGFIGITLVGLLVTVIVLAGGFGSAQARDQCHKINTTLTSVADLANFTTAGEIPSGFLRGTTAFTGDGDSLTPISSTTSPPVEPLTFSYTGDLEITTRRGTLTTRGVGVFEAVPFGHGSQFDHVIDGTGIFDGAEGHLYFDVMADETGAGFTSQVTGEICVE